MTTPQMAIVIPTDEAIMAARRLFARHRRRSRDNHCTFCGGGWLRRGWAGRLVDGCCARQLAAPTLQAAGELDALGRVIVPVGLR